jgi:hypothetical protein
VMSLRGLIESVLSSHPGDVIGSSPLMSPSTPSSSDDTATVIAVGTLAATLAAICHETLGHGLGCLSAGGHITLLTSIWFRCNEASAIADLGGPIGNLVAGSFAVALLSHAKASPRAKLFLLMFGTMNLFWLMGQLTFESLTSTHDDWYYLISLQIGRPGIWRIVGTIVGVGGYVFVSRWVSAIIRKQGGPQAHAIRLAYAAAATAAVVAGLMWRPEPFRSAFQAFLTLGIAPLGLLSVARKASRDVGHEFAASSVPKSWIWISACAVFYGIFLFAQAQGLGSMATSSLSP